MKNSEKAPTILAVASSGGHWHQMQQVKPAFEGASVIFASTSVGASEKDDANFHADIQLSDYNQNELGKVFLGFFHALKVIAKLRPDVVISTGAAPGLVCLFIGRIFGAKTIWLDSIANSEQLSLSGRLAQKFSHVVLTQWKHLSVPGKVQFWGSVI